MLLTITTTHQPATDLGYLLVKHPDRCQSFELSFGTAHVVYSEATEARCTAHLIMDLDPVGLVRGRRARGPAGAGQYVNDRPYVASSFLSVAIAKVLGSALGGRSSHRPELVDQAIPLEATVDPLPVRGDAGTLERLFEPLGYAVESTRHPLDENHPAWGESPYYRVTLRGEVPLRDLLSHLYVLMPVLDHEKHYWVDRAEVEKLLAKGERWLGEHPARDEIARRYLFRQPRLAREAIASLVAEDGIDPDAVESEGSAREETIERPLSLDEQRRGAVLAALRSAGARRVADLGCGEGKLLRVLLDDSTFEQVTGMDVSPRALERAASRLNVERLPPAKRARLHLMQGSLMYRDKRLEGFDATCLVEVIEHLDPPRLAHLERVVFGFAQPPTVIVTTPNREHNVLFERLAANAFRHTDHRFEWTRAELQAWAERVAEAHGYGVRFVPIGDEHPVHGAPTQMAVFTR